MFTPNEIDKLNELQKSQNLDYKEFINSDDYNKCVTNLQSDRKKKNGKQPGNYVFATIKQKNAEDLKFVYYSVGDMSLHPEYLKSIGYGSEKIHENFEIANSVYNRNPACHYSYYLGNDIGNLLGILTGVLHYFRSELKSNYDQIAVTFTDEEDIEFTKRLSASDAYIELIVDNQFKEMPKENALNNPCFKSIWQKFSTYLNTIWKYYSEGNRNENHEDAGKKKVKYPDTIIIKDSIPLVMPALRVLADSEWIFAYHLTYDLRLEPKNIEIVLHSVRYVCQTCSFMLYHLEFKSLVAIAGKMTDSTGGTQSIFQDNLSCTEKTDEKAARKMSKK